MQISPIQDRPRSDTLFVDCKREPASQSRRSSSSSSGSLVSARHEVQIASDSTAQEINDTLRKDCALLKTSYDNLYAKYRKEKGIWKQWIEHFDRKGRPAKPVPASNSRLSKTEDGNKLGSPQVFDHALRDLPNNVQKISRDNNDATHQAQTMKTPNPVNIVRSPNHDRGNYELIIRNGPPESRSCSKSTVVPGTCSVRSGEDLKKRKTSSSGRSTSPRDIPRASDQASESGASKATKPVSISCTARLMDNDAFRNDKEGLIKLENSLDDSFTASVIQHGQLLTRLAVPGRGLKRPRSGSEPISNDQISSVSLSPRPQHGLLDDSMLYKDDNDAIPHSNVQHKYSGQSRHAAGCICCSKFYSMAGPSAVPSAPVWRSPPTTEILDPAVRTTMQQVGRHRNARRSPTPPGFWDCDFPTTQELLLEKRANERRRQRRSMIDMRS